MERMKFRIVNWPFDTVRQPSRTVETRAGCGYSGGKVAMHESLPIALYMLSDDAYTATVSSRVSTLLFPSVCMSAASAGVLLSSAVCDLKKLYTNTTSPATRFAAL